MNPTDGFIVGDSIMIGGRPVPKKTLEGEYDFDNLPIKGGRYELPVKEEKKAEPKAPEPKEPEPENVIEEQIPDVMLSANITDIYKSYLRS